MRDKDDPDFELHVTRLQAKTIKKHYKKFVNDKERGDYWRGIFTKRISYLAFFASCGFLGYEIKLFTEFDPVRRKRRSNILLFGLFSAALYGSVRMMINGQHEIDLMNLYIRDKYLLEYTDEELKTIFKKGGSTQEEE